MNRRRQRFQFGEQLEPRLCLSAVTFVPREVSAEVSTAASVYVSDLDADGDLDVISGSYFDNKVAWYENTNGDGDFGPQQIIANEERMVNSVFVADMDGDGDGDVLVALDDKVVWYENSDGKATFAPQQTLALDEGYCHAQCLQRMSMETVI